MILYGYGCLGVWESWLASMGTFDFRGSRQGPNGPFKVTGHNIDFFCSMHNNSYIHHSPILSLVLYSHIPPPRPLAPLIHWRRAAGKFSSCVFLWKAERVLWSRDKQREFPVRFRLSGPLAPISNFPTRSRAESFLFVQIPAH